MFKIIQDIESNLIKKHASQVHKSFVVPNNCPEVEFLMALRLIHKSLVPLSKTLVNKFHVE